MHTSVCLYHDDRFSPIQIASIPFNKNSLDTRSIQLVHLSLLYQQVRGYLKPVFLQAHLHWLANRLAGWHLATKATPSLLLYIAETTSFLLTGRKRALLVNSEPWDLLQLVQPLHRCFCVVCVCYDTKDGARECTKHR